MKTVRGYLVTESGSGNVRLELNGELVILSPEDALAIAKELERVARQC